MDDSIEPYEDIVPAGEASLEYSPHYLDVWDKEIVCKWCCYLPAELAFESPERNLCTFCHDLAERVSTKQPGVCELCHRLCRDVVERKYIAPRLCGLCTGIFTVPEDTARLFTDWGLQHGAMPYLWEQASTGCALCRMFLLKDPNPDPARLEVSALRMRADGLMPEDYEVKGWTSHLAKLKSISFESLPDQYRLTLSVSAEADDPAARYITQRPYVKDLSSPERLGQARGWLRECLDSHEEQMPQSKPVLPTRVIDVGQDGSSYVRVFETQDDERADYVAMSYCWGKIPFLLTLTTNYEAHIQGIALSDLPTTLRDAVYVTRALGLRYIWIDALCIIQDSNDDKSREIGMMGDIYNQAALTLIAASATSVHEGFLDSPSPHARVKVPFRCPDGALGSVWLSPPLEVDIRTVPWNTRAWCMQEKFLSRRSLVFTDSDMFWQCQSMPLRRQESGHVQYLLDDPTASGSPFAQLSTKFNAPPPGAQPNREEADRRLLETWSQLVMDYTQRDLSFRSDKLPAIAGIASKTLSFRSDAYLAGLWSSQFINLLQWRRIGPANFRHYRPLPEYRAPSWSWASIDGAVQYPKIWQFDVGDLKGLRAQLVRCDVEPIDARNGFGALRSGGRAVVRAALIPTADSPYQHSVRLGPPAGYASLDYFDPAAGLVDDFHDKFTLIPRDVRESWLMLLGEGRMLDRKKGTMVRALMLKKLPAGAGVIREDGAGRREGKERGGRAPESECYVRIGYYECSAKNAVKHWVGAKNWKEITLL